MKAILWNGMLETSRSGSGGEDRWGKDRAASGGSSPAVSESAELCGPRALPCALLSIVSGWSAGREKNQRKPVSVRAGRRPQTPPFSREQRVRTRVKCPHPFRPTGKASDCGYVINGLCHKLYAIVFLFQILLFLFV